MTLCLNNFESNYAANSINGSIPSTDGLGGAIYFTCDESYNCTLNLTYQNNFNNNTAESSGGAIDWDSS